MFIFTNLFSLFSSFLFLATGNERSVDSWSRKKNRNKITMYYIWYVEYNYRQPLKCGFLCVCLILCCRWAVQRVRKRWFCFYSVVEFKFNIYNFKCEHFGTSNRIASSSKRRNCIKCAIHIYNKYVFINLSLFIGVFVFIKFGFFFVGAWAGHCL